MCELLINPTLIKHRLQQPLMIVNNTTSCYFSCYLMARRTKLQKVRIPTEMKQRWSKELPSTLHPPVDYYLLAALPLLLVSHFMVWLIFRFIFSFSNWNWGHRVKIHVYILELVIALRSMAQFVGRETKYSWVTAFNNIWWLSSGCWHLYSCCF